MTTAAVPSRRPRAVQRISNVLANPWGKARFLWVIAIAYMLWSLVPVVIAILFSFNDGRSRNTWQGFSTQWYWENPESVWNDPLLQHSLVQSLKLAAGTMLIATPIGVLLALALTRWRGWGKRPSNLLMLLPLITPELVMATALFFVFTQLFHNFIELGTTAQLLGHVTFSLSYVVVIVRARLVSLGREYEEAAMDLGASPLLSLRLVVLPLLLPAIVASLMVVFAISIDDFITSQYLAAGPDTTTMPMLIYGSARGVPRPSTNALAAIMVGFTLLSLILAYLLYRVLTRHERGSNAVRDFAGMEL